MIIKFEKETEGVLLACSKKGLKKYFTENDFNYDFPEGILPLINKGIVIAIITETSEEVSGQIIDIGMNDYTDYELVGEQTFYLEQNDDIYILSHSEFSQICTGSKGDIDTFKFWNEKIIVSNLKEGWFIAFTHFKLIEGDDNSILDIIIQLTPTKTQIPFGEVDSIPTL